MKKILKKFVKQKKKIWNKQTNQTTFYKKKEVFLCVILNERH